MAEASVLASEVYARAFEQVSSGSSPALLGDEERAALRDGRAEAGVTGPGYPMPAHADPTRNRTGLHVDGDNA